ncbi:hypothetical protein DQ04_04411060 [Trypanosoma grayi]|uniref:hypothetical protein n=1 Tax=Trypanosoma grayi TaxID=71804 RepID=UPI0004F44471|nr:hypothetical protein DQ04_04411060 [Trypanosoma grayi]KEG09945.1 hypothetical protein DQ04_04411060 [Trypanosoma grayi]
MKKETSNSLPDINRASTVPAAERFHHRNQQRTVHRVCGSTVGHDGYLKMLRGVRKHFLDKPDQEPTVQLPLILQPHLPSEAKAADGTASLHFSQGLRFKSERGRIVARELRIQERQTPLAALEEEERQHIMDTEVWELRVLNQMMIVSYVTFVLRDEMDELYNEEREKRANLVFEEDKERYWMQNESEASKQLISYKAALRAREEKQRRLEEAEALYPTCAPSRCGFTCQPPQDGTDARKILQRYVRLKHALDSSAPSAEASDPKRPEQKEGKPGFAASNHRSTARLSMTNGLRNTIGIASYVVLLEKDADSRKVIAECEQGEYDSIMSLFKEELSLMRAWQHRRLHLERLLYWQGQREERRQELQTALEAEAMKSSFKLDSECGGWIQSEENDRGILRVEEATRRNLLQQMYCAATHQVLLKKLDAEEDEGRFELEYDETIARQVWLQHLELAVRVTIEEEWERCFEESVPQQIILLKFLNEEQKAHACQIVTIQRAVRNWRSGCLGWRFTHRDVGRIIRAKRDAEMIERGRESLCAFKASLMADCDAVRDEIFAIHDAERADVCEKEFQHRVMINSQEEWGAAAIRRQAQQDILQNIIAPQIERCIKTEVDCRREIDVAGEFESLQLCNVFRRLIRIMQMKQLAEGWEEGERFTITRDEALSFKEILDTELDNRELLRITALEREAEQEEERHTLAASLLRTKSEEQQLYGGKIQQLIWRCRAGALELEASNPSLRASLLQSYLVGKLQLYEEASLLFLAEFAVTLQNRYSDLVFTGLRDLLMEDEKLARRSIVQTERSAWPTVVDEANRNASEQLRWLNRQTAAANTIKSFYRRYKSGTVGASGMRNYLQEMYAFKREKKELGEIRQLQRQDVQRCKEELQMAMQEAALERQKEIGFKLQVLADKTEPRARADVEKLEDIMFNVMLRNLGTNGYYQATDGVAVLWQFESYDRVRIMREWRRAFEDVFEPKKSTFVLDILIGKLQRSWRCRVARRKHMTVIKEGMKQLVREESEARVKIELKEMDGYACTVMKPMEGCALLRGYLTSDVPRFLNHMCFDIAYTNGIQEEEWRNRMLLLWKMRHHYFDTTVSSEEASTREALQQTYFFDGVDQVALTEDEGTLRDALWNERIFFLLRMLVKAERERRGILEFESSKDRLDISECQARGSLYKDYYELLANPICNLFATEQATTIVEEEIRARHSIKGLTKTILNQPHSTGINCGDRTCTNNVPNSTTTNRRNSDEAAETNILTVLEVPLTVNMEIIQPMTQEIAQKSLAVDEADAASAPRVEAEAVAPLSADAAPEVTVPVAGYDGVKSVGVVSAGALVYHVTVEDNSMECEGVGEQGDDELSGFSPGRPPAGVLPSFQGCLVVSSTEESGTFEEDEEYEEAEEDSLGSE